MSKANNGTGGEFAALLAEIEGQGAATEVLAKAVKDNGDAARIEAAAAEGAGDGDPGDTDADGKKKLKDGEGEPVMKALKVVNAEGEETDAVDATDLLKSLMEKTETIEANSTTGLRAVLGVVAKQGELIKSLTETVGALRTQGTGRRSVLAVAEKPGTAAEVLAKSLETSGAADASAANETGMPREEFFSKALAAAEKGLISYHECNHSETLVNKGGSPLASVVAAVQKLSATA